MQATNGACHPLTFTLTVDTLSHSCDTTIVTDDICDADVMAAMPIPEAMMPAGPAAAAAREITWMLVTWMLLPSRAMVPSTVAIIPASRAMALFRTHVRSQRRVLCLSSGWPHRPTGKWQTGRQRSLLTLGRFMS